MRRKETVIVFDGEDKFISSRPQPKSDKLSPDGERFKKYMLQKNSPVVIPKPDDADFCERAQYFIKTSCDGKATPEQVWQVHELFQKHCLKKGEESATGEESDKKDIAVESKLEFPDFTQMDCAQLAAKIKEYEDLLMSARMPMDVLARYKAAIDDAKKVQSKKCAIESPKPPTGGEPKPPFISLTPPNLGVPPAKATPGGGSDEPNKKRKNNLLFLLLLVAAGVYLLTRKKE